jgi:hypothetical protein
MLLLTFARIALATRCGGGVRRAGSVTAARVGVVAATVAPSDQRGTRIPAKVAAGARP